MPILKQLKYLSTEINICQYLNNSNIYLEKSNAKAGGETV